MTRAETLDRAKACVCGKRQEDYGTPEDNFGMIAEMWSWYTTAPITAENVAVMMIMLKIARTMSGKGTADCWVDIAGYAACACEISTGKVAQDED